MTPTFKQFISETKTLDDILPDKKLRGYWSIPKDMVRIVTVEDVANQWQKNGHKLYDKNWNKGEYNLMVPISTIEHYKEYSRTKEKGNLYPDDWDKLKKDLKENGIQIPGHITVYRNGRKSVLTEGNHRLAIAKELGIKEMPIIFFFYEGD